MMSWICAGKVLSLQSSLSCTSCQQLLMLTWHLWYCSEELLGAVWGINKPQSNDSLSMANEAPAAVEHADSNATSVEPLSPMVSDAAGPEDGLPALQTLSLDCNKTSYLANKQQFESLEEEETVPAITQPAGLTPHTLQGPLPDKFGTSAAASLSTFANTASTLDCTYLDSTSAPTAIVSAATTQPSAADTICPTMPAAFKAAASPPPPHAKSPAVPSRHPQPFVRSPAVPSRHAAPASTGAVRGQQASRRPGPAHCDADELWAAWHWGNGALHGASAPNMAQCASHPPHAPKKR